MSLKTPRLCQPAGVSLFRGSVFLSVVGLVTLTVAVFFPIFTADFVDYDDPAFVTKNEYVSEGLTLRNLRWAVTQEDLGGEMMHEGIGNVWHPLTWISHQLDASLFGTEKATGHHVHNLLLHLGAVILAYFCALKLKWGGGLSLFTAIVFAVHPTHVESVAWISERKDVLSAFFFFGTLLAWLHGRKWLSVGLYVCALMAKPSVVPLPVLLLLIEWWRNGFRVSDAPLKALGSAITRVLPWIIPVLLVVGVTLWSQYGGTHRDFIMPLSQRLLQMPAALVFYLWRSFVPLDLSFHYPYPASMQAYLFAALILAVIGLILWRGRKKVPALIFGAGWFLLLWIPVSGIFHVGTSFTSDRYLYLAHFGLFAGVFLTLRDRVPRNVFLGLAGVFSLILVPLCHAQVRVWKDSETLFAHGVKAQPRDPVAPQNLAVLYQMRGDRERAKLFYGKALELAPFDHIALTNLGRLEKDQEEMSEATVLTERALEVAPNYIPALRLRVELALEQGELPIAEELGRKVLALTGGGYLADVKNYLRVLRSLGRPQQVEAILQQVPEEMRQELRGL